MKSFYVAVKNYEAVSYKFMWKTKIPLRVETFLWLVLKKKTILTRDVLLKRGGVCTKSCLFCGQDESIKHLFFACPLARYVWSVIGCATGLKCQFDSAEMCLTEWLGGFDNKKIEN